MSNTTKHSIHPVGLCLSASAAITGPVLLHSLWTGDFRYLPDHTQATLTLAWAFGAALMALAAHGVWQVWRSYSARG